MSAKPAVDRKWTVKIEGKEYLVEAEYGWAVKDDDAGYSDARKGRLLVNGKEVNNWDPGSLPKEIHVEIGGKPATFEKKGFFAAGLEFTLDGKRIKPA